MGPNLRRHQLTDEEKMRMFAPPPPPAPLSPPVERPKPAKKRALTIADLDDEWRNETAWQAFASPEQSPPAAATKQRRSNWDAASSPRLVSSSPDSPAAEESNLAKYYRERAEASSRVPTRDPFAFDEDDEHEPILRRRKSDHQSEEAEEAEPEVEAEAVEEEAEVAETEAEAEVEEQEAAAASSPPPEEDQPADMEMDE